MVRSDTDRGIIATRQRAVVHEASENGPDVHHTEPHSQPARDVAQRVQHVFLLRDLLLLLAEHLAVSASGGAHTRNVFSAEAGDAPFENGAAAHSLAASRAMAGVSFASAGRPISPSSSWMRVSEVRLKNVDCWS